MVECDSFVEDGVPGFLHGKCEKNKSLVEFRFGEAHELVLSTGVVTFPYNFLEYAGGMFVTESFTFDVESKIPGFGHEVKPFLNLTYYFFTILHFHDENPVALK